MQEKNILVTAIGSFSADVVISILREHNYKVIGTNIYPMPWIANAMMVDNFYQVPLASEEKEYVRVILDICQKENIGYIFPLTDVEIDVFNRCREVFVNNGIVLCLSPYETILTCRDKRKTSEILKQKVPEIQIIPEYKENQVKYGSVEFPIICKKINGRSSQGLKKIHSIEEFLLFSKNHDFGEYIIQPFVEGDILTVDVIRDSKNDKCVAAPRKELLRTLNGAGTSVYVFRDFELEEICKKIAKVLNIHGCVNFEFIESKDKKFFLECNPRFSGGVKFTCMSGYDCIMNHLYCFQGKEIDEKIKIVPQYIARKYNEYVTCVKGENTL